MCGVVQHVENGLTLPHLVRFRVMRGIFFHLSRLEMRGGDIVPPGGYGQRVRNAGENGRHRVREQVLERVRAERYPAKPCRLDACFATLNIQTAMFYHQHHCPEGLAYCVTLVDCSAPYWSGKQLFKIDGCPDLVCEELVTSSALRVVNRISFTL